MSSFQSPIEILSDDEWEPICNDYDEIKSNVLSSHPRRRKKVTKNNGQMTIKLRFIITSNRKTRSKRRSELKANKSLSRYHNSPILIQTDSECNDSSGASDSGEEIFLTKKTKNLKDTGKAVVVVHTEVKRGKRTLRRVKSKRERVLRNKDGTEERPEKQEKWASINNKCSPLQLFKAIRKLKSKQKEAVKNMGFGKLLCFQVEGIPQKIGHYVVDMFDESKMEIGGIIKVDEESIYNLLGIPNTGIDLESIIPTKNLNDRLVEWTKSYKCLSRPKLVASLTEAGDDDDDDDDDDDLFKFKLDFLVLFLSTMVECRSNGICKLDILQYINEETDFSKINWCSYVVNCLKHCKIGWRRNTKDPFKGGLTILTLLYVDNVTCKGMNVDRTIPAIEYWDQDKLKRRQVLEIASGGFGKGDMIPVDGLDKGDKGGEKANVKEENTEGGISEVAEMGMFEEDSNNMGMNESAGILHKDVEEKINPTVTPFRLLGHMIKQGCQLLKKLENNSQTVKGSKLIGQDNESLSVILLPLKKRDRDLQSTGDFDNFLWELISTTANILRLKKSDHNDLLVNSLFVIKQLLDNCESGFGDSYIRHWVAIVELYKEVSSYTEDASGRLLYESIACITVIVSRASHGLKASLCADKAINDLKGLLDHANSSGLPDTLISHLVTCGTSLMSGSSNLLNAACEACRAIWSLIDAFEIQSKIANPHVFPLNAMYSRSHNIHGDQYEAFTGTKDSERIVDGVTRALLGSKVVHVFSYCLRRGVGAAWLSAIQIILRCCLHNSSVSGVLCGLHNTLPVVSGGGDDTIISEIFSVLSFCTSINISPQTGGTNCLKSEISNPGALIYHSCLVLAAVAQSLKSTGRHSALFMLTSSPKIQQSRLCDLAHHYALCDSVQNSFEPHSLSAMLAFASILALESNSYIETLISEIAVPLIPPTATLCGFLRNFKDDNQLIYWHGFRDGCVGLLDYILTRGGALAIQQVCDSGILQTLIDLLGNKHSYQNQIGLSPVGVVWTISSLCQCLSGGSSTLHQVLLKREHVKLLSDLISDVHLKLIKCWRGPGSGKDGIRDTVNSVINLLEFPFVAVTHLPVKSGFLLNVDVKVCADDKELVQSIKESMTNYIQILLEVRIPAHIIQCLKHIDLKDVARPVAFLAKMTTHMSMVEQLLGNGLLDPNMMSRLLDKSSLNEVKLDVLTIISVVACMHEDFYENIKGADILELLKGFLTHEDPKIRANACCALGNMCKHNNFFYDLLAKHNIVSVLVDCCSDADKHTRNYACFAIGNAAYHNDFYYEELSRCIPQLVNLLLSEKELDKIKINAMGALSNLVRHSDKFSHDMVSRGAMEALLKLLEDPSTKESLERALVVLFKMCAHAPCRQFLRASEQRKLIDTLSESGSETIVAHASAILERASQQ